MRVRERRDGETVGVEKRDRLKGQRGEGEKRE